MLDGVKSLVPRAAQRRAVRRRRRTRRRPALFVVESGTAGVLVEAEPAMGLRAAATGRLVLDGRRAAGRRPARRRAADVYAECIRLARIGWAALACGTGQAVLDYVIPYVNERKAFGEPISNRQAVAFMVADIGIELEGARLTTLRAAAAPSRACRSPARPRSPAGSPPSTACRSAADGVQLLGGHGYVKEHPVERWYRDLRAAGVMEGVVLV